MTTALCACGQPSPDASICQACTDRLAADLAAVPWLREQLDVALSRQTATGRQDGGRSAEKPMPYDEGASDALEMLGTALRRWMRKIAGDWIPYPHRIDVQADMLRSEIGTLAQHQDADQAAKEIGNAVAKARRSIDRRPERVFAGCCDGHGHQILGPEAPDQGCGQWLYARMGAPEVRCGSCSTSYDVVMRRGWMLEAAEDYLVNATTLSRFVSRLGAPVKANTIQQWKSRGRLEQRGADGDGHPIYRIGDVLDLVTAEAHRKARVAR